MKQEANLMSKNVKNNVIELAVNKEKKGLNRRKLLGSLAVVGGVSALPTSWVKPVINSVILPAHAQTSESDPSASTTPTSASNPSAPTTPTTTGLTLNNSTEFTISSTGNTLLPPIDITPDTAITSGGVVTVSVFPAGVVFLVAPVFEDSNNITTQGSQLSVVPGGAPNPQVFQNSSGQDFVLTFTINSDSDTLNVSLDLI